MTADTQAGIAFLKDQEGIDTSRIGLLGHSMGIIIATIVANRSPDVAFLVLLAGPGVWGKEFFCLQAQAIARAGGNKNFKIVELPGMNHMLQECRTGQIPEY